MVIYLFTVYNVPDNGLYEIFFLFGKFIRNLISLDFFILSITKTQFILYHIYQKLSKVKRNYLSTALGHLS